MITTTDVVLPCLNEADALPGVLARLPAGYRAIVVDNGSTDDTARVAEAAGARVVVEPRRGYGAAVHAGLTAATAEFVCVLDADGSLPPEMLPTFVEALVGTAPNGTPPNRTPPSRTAPNRTPPDGTAPNRTPPDGSAPEGVDGGSAPDDVGGGSAPDDVGGGSDLGGVDLAVGRRIPVGAGVWPWHARAGNLLIAALLRRRGLPVHDIAPVRAARRSALLALGVGDRASGYPLELLLRAGAAGWRIREFDVPYAPRAGGRSKVSGSVRGTVRAAVDMTSVLAGSR